MPETRTKIVATAGPALDPPGAMERLIAAGVDVLRLNLSHGPVDSHRPRVERARAVRPDLAVLADLSGPKLRLGELPEPVVLAAGDTVALGPGGLPVADPDFALRVGPGDPVYLADGTLRLDAVRIVDRAVECRVEVGGTLTSRKGINLPGDRSSRPCLTDKDLADLKALPAVDADYVALSYVRHENDLAEVRKLTDLPVIAKIEKQQALDRLDEILASADALMVARGDLGVEIPIERVPAAQKRLIRAANRAGKPVITATQMLVSMVTNPLPTRAEVTDVANAVLDGTDAVMLSEETAMGRDPAGAVETMDRILRETEPLRPHRLDDPDAEPSASAMARAAVRLAMDLKAGAILVPTMSGASARRVAACRPEIPIVAFSPDRETVRRLSLVWGVEPHSVPGYGPTADIVAGTLESARKLLPPGTGVILIAGWPPGIPGNTSFIHAARL